jgi:NADH pyrophosphatase NudC (nudix superfamily)
MEETNLEIKNIKYLTSLVFIRPDNIPVVVLSFFADHHKGNIKLSSELTEYAWVTLEESKNYELIGGIYEELEMLHNHLNGRTQENWKKSDS